MRKDGDAPSVRTITNYFAPKTVEKPFSPPRSNNIMDYFKKTSPAQEMKSCSLKAKENSPQPSEQVSHEVSGKPVRGQGQKRTRKTKDKKKSKEEDLQVITDDVVLIESPGESKESETSGLPDQTCPDYKESTLRKNATEDDSNALTVNNSVESSEKKPLLKKNGGNKKSAVRRNRKVKVDCEETKECDGDAQEPVCDTKPEECADKKKNTVTISFVDFMHNQSLEEEVEESNAVSKTDTAETSSEMKICNNSSDSAVGPLQVSPRTLTIQAEVHPISPDHHESLKVSKDFKVASIFSRNKKSQSKDEKRLSDPMPEVKPDVLPDLKRKSNVVLFEEDLELDVVESSSNPKSTEAERKQFMNAFKQPILDGIKNKPNKGQSKTSQVQEQVLESAEKEPEERTIEKKPEVTSSEKNEETKSCSDDKKEQVRKSGKKRQAKKAKSKQDTTQKPEETPTEIEVEKEKESSPTEDDNPEKAVRELRRSTRDLSRRQSAAVPQKKEKQENAVKDDETQNTPYPSLASTPKAQRPRRGIYRAEILCPPDTKCSPIR